MSFSDKAGMPASHISPSWASPFRACSLSPSSSSLLNARQAWACQRPPSAGRSWKSIIYLCLFRACCVLSPTIHKKEEAISVSFPRRPHFSLRAIKLWRAVSSSMFVAHKMSKKFLRSDKISRFKFLFFPVSSTSGLINAALASAPAVRKTFGMPRRRNRKRTALDEQPFLSSRL